MPHRGRTTAILLATGAVVVLVLGVSNFWGDIVWFFQSDAERIQGKWAFVSAVYDGQAVPSEQEYCIFEGEKVHSVTEINEYRLDERHQPGWINMKSLLGIYELNGDTLRMCFSELGKRPIAFESKAGSKHILFVLQRE